MTPANLKILQNQKRFNTSPYREHVTPLPEALQQLGLPVWTTRVSLEGYLCGALLYICASRFNVVVSVSLPPAFIYGLLSRLFGKPKALHIAKEFYLEASAQKLNLRKWFRLTFLRFALNKVDGIILNASAEANYYSEILSLPKDRFRFVPWPSNVSEPKVFKEDNGYFLAVGRSLRDWKTFFKAVEDTPYSFIVVASRTDAEHFPVMKNVMIKTDIPREEYLRFLQGARGMILPLKPTIRSTGQASFLEAMAYGKAVIATDVVGVHDYLQNEKNALLCPAEDYLKLREAIERLNDDSVLRCRLQMSGFNDINDRFNGKRYAEAMVETVSNLMRTPGTDNNIKKH